MIEFMIWIAGLIVGSLYFGNWAVGQFKSIFAGILIAIVFLLIYLVGSALWYLA